MKILVAAPVHDRAWIIKDFLDSVKALETEGLSVGYLFIENDSADNSLELLRKLTARWPNCEVRTVTNHLPAYDRKGTAGDPMYLRMAILRESIRQATLDGGYDYLLSCDSDIMMQPETLQRLLSHNLDMVAAMISNSGSAVFSAVNAMEFMPASGPPPYNQPAQWIHWRPIGKGARKVGGTGACFLASRGLLERSSYLYRPDMHSRYWIPLDKPGHIYGEDYAFAMSCGDAGLEQHLDESLRNWHCYTPELLEIYRKAKAQYKRQAVKRIADRAWLGVDQKLLVPGCGSCGQTRRDLYG